MAVSSMIETGVSFTDPAGRWVKHAIALDLEVVAARLDGEALERFETLPLAKQILCVRAIEELMLCVFRRTRKDPEYSPKEDESWKAVLEKLIGSEGLDRVGI